MSDIFYNWNRQSTGGIDTPPPAGILFDETLRDGIQAPTVRTPALDRKCRIVDHMVRSGVRAADLGFPGSSKAAAAECLALAKHVTANRYPLAQGYAGRTHLADIRAINEIAQAVGTAVDAYVFIGVSPIRLYAEEWTVTSITEQIRAAVIECRRGGAEFVLVLEDAVRCTPEILARVFDVALDTGVARITLCDTVGAATPDGTAALLGWSRRYFADRGRPVAFEWHGHNDRGLALANSLVALAAGCVRVHGTVLGIGERAGNASLDQLIINRHLDGSGGYDLRALREYCEFASDVLGVGIPPNYPAMGRDVFSTSAGVHAAAILKAHERRDPRLKDAVYSGVPAGALGRDQQVIVDHSSGASNVRYWLAIRGERADDAAIQKVLSTAKTYGRPLSDDEIGQIIATAA